jgi:hypothetical protein
MNDYHAYCPTCRASWAKVTYEYPEIDPWQRGVVIAPALNECKVECAQGHEFLATDGVRDTGGSRWRLVGVGEGRASAR